MEYTEYTDEKTETKICYSSFIPVEEEQAVEYHLIISPECGGSVEKQAIAIKAAYSEFLHERGLTEDNEFFARVFLSDAINQIKAVNKVLDQKGNAFSLIEQAPLPDKKISAWIWLVGGGGSMKKYSPDGITTFRKGLKHIFSFGKTANFRDFSSGQTDYVFSKYTKLLTEQGMNLKDNVIRTWLFVRDIDNNYEGVVAARREFFKKHGLTKDTHYISSTGIEGKSFDPDQLMIADIYAIKGIKREQIKFLSAANNLNPTHEYGVTFERGTTIDYADRKHIFISGTASIDNKGKIVAENDIMNQ
ncbi:MAG: hypothetical protein PF588_03625, partial [Candidatus Kapabacteria bacterium]|nr:hypothetical protein [Candidatus Kapabacteria bacterium]